MKKAISLFVTIIMFVTIFTACGDEKSKTTITTAKAKVTKAVVTTQTEETTVAAGDRSSPKVKVGNAATTKAKSKSTTAAKSSGNSENKSGATNAKPIPQNTTPPNNTNDSQGIFRGEFGTWNNNVFTNRWDNIKFPLPSGYRYYSNDELKSEYGNSNIATNGDDLNIAANASKKFRMDCSIENPDASAGMMLLYALDCNCSVSDMQSFIQSTLMEDEEYVGNNNVTIAGKQYNMARYKGTDETDTLYYEDIYITQYYNSDMIIIITAYSDACSIEINSFIYSITQNVKV